MIGYFSFLLLLLVGIFFIHKLFVLLPFSSKVEKCSNKISLIDKEIAKELRKT
jgi:hypothetical protein